MAQRRILCPSRGTKGRDAGDPRVALGSRGDRRFTRGYSPMPHRGRKEMTIPFQEQQGGVPGTRLQDERTGHAREASQAHFDRAYRSANREERYVAGA